MSRIPSRELSLEETYSLASVARRKSNSGASKADLRQQLGTAQLLEALDNAIRNSPPPSPQQSCLKLTKSHQHIQWAQLDQHKEESKPEVDEYGFAYEEDEEDNGLSLSRTASRSS